MKIEFNIESWDEEIRFWLSDINGNTFSILDNLNYEEIKKELNYYNNVAKIIKKLWKQKATMFFYWYLMNSDVELETKKYYFWYIFDEENYDDFSSVFTENQKKDFAYFILENWLMDNTYSKINNCIDLIWNDFLKKEYVGSFIYLDIDKLEWIDDKLIIDFVFDNGEEIYNTLQNTLENENIRNKLSWEKNNFDKIIRKIIEKEELYFLEKLNLLELKDFEFLTQYLLNEWINQNIYFENLEDKKDKEKNIFLNKLEKLWLDNIKDNYIEIDNDYSSYTDINPENNYLKLLYKNNPELFNNIDINSILKNESNIPSYILLEMEKKIITNFLKLDSIDYWDLINNNGKIVDYDYWDEDNNIFTQEQVVNHIVNNFSQKEIINYFIFLKFRISTFYSFSDTQEFTKIIESKNILNKIPFLDKIKDYKFWIENKITEYRDDYSSNSDKFLYKIVSSYAFNDVYNFKIKTNNYKYKKLLSNSSVIEFISLFPESFNDFSDVLNFFKNTKILKIEEYINTDKLDKIIKIIILTKKVKNINFDLKLSDINDEFVGFIENNFYDKIWGDIFYKSTDELNKIFDVEINSIDFFITKYKKEYIENDNKELEEYQVESNKKNFFQENTQIQNAILYSDSHILRNINEICDLFNIEKTIWNYTQIEENFNVFLWIVIKIIFI